LSGFMLFFYYDILYLEVNKDFTDCKQCLLPLLWSRLQIRETDFLDFFKESKCTY